MFRPVDLSAAILFGRGEEISYDLTKAPFQEFTYLFFRAYESIRKINLIDSNPVSALGAMNFRSGNFLWPAHTRFFFYKKVG